MWRSWRLRPSRFIFFPSFPSSFFCAPLPPSPQVDKYVEILAANPGVDASDRKTLLAVASAHWRDVLTQEERKGYREKAAGAARGRFAGLVAGPSWCPLLAAPLLLELWLGALLGSCLAASGWWVAREVGSRGAWGRALTPARVSRL